MKRQLGAIGVLDFLRNSWFLIAFVAGVIYWVARQDSSLDELHRADSRITALENRTTILETGLGQLQIKIDNSGNRTGPVADKNRHNS